MKQGRPRVQRVELRGCMALTFWIEPGRDALAIWQTRRDGTRSPYGERAGTGLARHMASGLGRDALTICRAGRDRTPSPYDAPGRVSRVAPGWASQDVPGLTGQDVPGLTGWDGWNASGNR
ncbi:hypothetical protein F2Q69_00005421 [Brassica cretica]|uniref:Uncharacterized protein n=1 Tax=Brassica cretica TaxID=69181 RepID=A0A8S9NVM4_BRACR|nr:hypothetical protein F2Q69_00005421 [Brassica cretica]